VHPLLPPGSDPSAACTKETYTSTRLLAGTSQPMTKVYGTRSSEGNGKGGKGWRVSAGPILRRGTSNSLSQVKIDRTLVLSLGYVLQEPAPRAPLDTATLIPLLQLNALALASLDPPIKHPLSLLSHLNSFPPPPPYTLPSGEILHPPSPSGVPPRKIVIFGDCSGGILISAFNRCASMRACSSMNIQTVRFLKGYKGEIKG